MMDCLSYLCPQLMSIFLKSKLLMHSVLHYNGSRWDDDVGIYLMQKMQKDSIDLMNVDYDDVLQLYKGWRRSENALKDKNKELSAMKMRIKQLQESHAKFRGQIQALESVKELTVSLQSQLSSLQQENKFLASENTLLTEKCQQLEFTLNEKDRIEEKQNRMLSEVQIDFSTLKGKYEECLKAQKELEKTASEEHVKRRAAETRISFGEESKDDLLSENKSLKQKLEHSMLRLSQCDHELAHASDQLHLLSKELAQIQSTDSEIGTLRAENGLLRGDISRLLRLIEYFPANKELFDMWHDSNGMVFVGIDEQRVDESNSNTFPRGAIFEMSDAIDDSNHHQAPSIAGLITPTEFAHLKRIHGGDPFPLTNNVSVSEQ